MALHWTCSSMSMFLFYYSRPELDPALQRSPLCWYHSFTCWYHRPFSSKLLSSWWPPASQHSVVSPQVQDFAFLFVGTSWGSCWPFSSVFWGPFDGSKPSCLSTFPILGWSANLLRVPSSRAVSVEQYQLQYPPLGYTTIESPPAGLCSSDDHLWVQQLSQFPSTSLTAYLVCTWSFCQWGCCGRRCQKPSWSWGK